MIIDYTSAIKAYAEARIAQLGVSLDLGGEEARIDELERIVALCDGLMKQQEIIAEALRK